MGHARDTCKTLPGDPPVELRLRRSARARRITLRVSSLDGRVTLSLPRGVSERAGLAFAQERSDWIRSHLAKRVPGRSIAMGCVLPVLGTSCEIVEGAPGLGNGVLRVRGGQPVGPQVQAIVKEAARSALVAASGRHAAAIGRVPGRITLRDNRSRWGSCSSQGNLNYSWRLALAPAEVLDYVAAHEVAHLEQMNHSPAFWSVVAQLCPDWKAHRAWLRAHGVALHAWQFG